MYLIQQLHNEIERKRAELINMGLSLGLDNQLTVQFSQELDDLLNQYQQMKRTPRHTNARYIPIYHS
ncbi:aspartyl-phosphate phosphatase Spo0E family protein [Massilibacterium senegalense]|uniref:aspartyl-phosphate phosphatase Spo0E family protein n=1 Tax=Massilibacterium senegalense TaxID=1632858 RepID=UPI0007842E39|nr:aspartyl-phosphate phosphatase Spo0E family protein [Massilibacterium senegalense]